MGPSIGIRARVGLEDTYRQMRTPEGLKNVQEELDSFAIGIRRVVGEVVERVPEAGLPKHLERRACHPAVDVHLLSSAILGQTLRNRCLDLTQCLVAEQDHT